ncbi:zinc finger protein 91-like [Mizuhopecten yessoensis]|uniref:zinc finger protein 91-like n=1 Tax=Mizuhopecten yessoensis TaxID=6573 RepID=UPI000B45B895|nr:zinc finger protein 91-like [Mizuhopecten yessoensis]
MAASTYISDTENVSNNQLVESINNSYITNYQSSSVVKSEPLDGESFIEPVAEKNNEDTNIFQRTDFGLWDIEQRCLEEKNVTLKTEEYVEDLSVPQQEEALDEENGKFSCDICGKVFTQISDLRKHTKLHKQSIKCDVCNRCFSQKSQLQTHMKIHNRNTVNKCAFCEKTFKRKNAFQMHMDSLHTMTSCDICGRQVPGTLMFQYHTLAHEHEKKSRDFCCDACGEIYKTVDSFRTHLEIHKNDGIPYTCEICGKTFTTITNIGRHMSSHKKNPSDTHQSSNPSSDCSESNNDSISTSQTLTVSDVQNFITVFICELCDETFLCKLKLETHYESHKTECRDRKHCKKTFDTGTALKKDVENAQTTTTTCNICGKEVSKNDLKTHKAELHTKDRHNACAKEYSGLNGEKSHIPTSNSKEEKKYSCDICGKRFTQTSGIRRHMIFHQQNIKCDRCGRHFSEMRSLRSHMKIHLRTEFPKCEICDQSFKTKVVLQRHIRTYHTTESCDICGLQIHLQLMGNHKLAHEHENKSRDFICSICEDSFKTADSFRTHLEIHKNDDRPYTCEVCGKTYITVRNLKEHARLHKDCEDTQRLRDSEDSSIKNGSTIKNLQMPELDDISIGQKKKSVTPCNLCGKIFSKKLNLDLHLKRHRREEKKRNQRKEIFKTEISLGNHIDNVHMMKPCEVSVKTFTKGEPKHQRADHINKKQYNCDVCGKMCNGLNGIKRHMVFHEGVNDKKSRCDICGKNFVQTRSLKMHMKIHKQSIKCDRCGCCFSSKAHLNSHMKIHMRTVFPKCEMCDKSFKTKVVLQRHIRIFHTTESCDICGLQINRQLMGNHKLAHEHERESHDFICSICADRYKNADSFRTHLEIHKDEDRPYTCEICGKTFITFKSIKDH